jgi:hypothetical protein
MTRISQSFTPAAGEQTEGEKDKMKLGDIGEGSGEDNKDQGPLVIPFPGGARVILSKGRNEQIIKKYDL